MKLEILCYSGVSKLKSSRKCSLKIGRLSNTKKYNTRVTHSIRQQQGLLGKLYKIYTNYGQLD